MSECSRRRRFDVLDRVGLLQRLGTPARLLSLVSLALLIALGSAAPAIADDHDGDGYDESVDCDDTNPAIHPHALEICNGVDDNCKDGIDEGLADPDPVIQNVGFYSCVFHVDGLCKTAGRAICVPFPGPGAVSAPPPDGQPDLHLTCVARGNPPIPNVISVPESLANGNCHDGVDNDCDTVVDDHGNVVTDHTDLKDADCVEAEKCDGIDNDGDGFADEDFSIGTLCTAGLGICEKPGTIVCDTLFTTKCSATPGTPKIESSQVGDTCGNNKDDDCDGLKDAADIVDCAGFGVAELCNGVDDDHDGTIDEGFPNKGLPCTVGLGACGNAGVYVCSPDGSQTVCSVTAGTPTAESEAAGTCGDFLDNDCDGFADASDVDCASAFADLGVTCSLPYRTGKAGSDCQGKNIITFSGGQATEVHADLLALSPTGDVLGIIEDVENGEEAQLASRVQLQVDTKRNRYKIFAPVPLLRVTGRKGSVEDVAYCGILPYLEINEPKGVTVSLSESSDQHVQAYLPLVNVDTLNIQLDGINVLSGIGINPATQFPTGSGVLCATAGSCVFQVPAGCGDGTLTNVEISNLRVEGIDTAITPDARNGVEVANQVNTVSFTVKGLPAGGHIFHISGQPMPLPKRLATPCHEDDLDDTGTLSAFGIKIDNPQDQEIVATAPVHVQGTVCSGNAIAKLRINGGDVPVGGQTCTTGNGVSAAPECTLHFDKPIGEKDLQDAAVGNAVNASYKRGGNRVVADASDDKGNRTFNTDVVFGLGAVQNSAATSMLAALPSDSGLRAVVNDIQTMMATEINPAFVVGLEEAAVQKFFNEKCQGAIDQFTARAEAALSGKTFATFDIEPDCSCNLNNVPIVLENLSFTPTTANPACAVDFQNGQIGVAVHLPDTHIQVGAHRSCTDHGLFGECIARTKVDVTAVTNIKNVSFAFTITETQIEKKEAPDKDAFFFTWDIQDNNGRSAILTKGHCHDNPARECYGNKKEDPGAGTSAQCDGGVCDGFAPNPSFDPVTHKDVGIECWGASICLAFEAIGAFLITVFTFGLVNGFDLIGFLDFDFNVNPEFLDELKAAEPDAMGLNEVQVDEGKVQQAGFATFTPGKIDVTIRDGGLTVALPATFETTSIDPTVPVTPPASETPASAPTVAQLIGTTDDISMLIADDVFNRLFKAMQESGKLKACSNADSLTVDKLLPAESAGGCEALGPNNAIGAALQGICHAIREHDCLNLPPSDTNLKTNTKKGACVGFSGGDCTQFPVLSVPRDACNITPARDIKATDSVLICAREDMAPDLTIAQTSGTAHSVSTSLFLEDLNVAFILDRGNDGYNGTLEALGGCWGATGEGQPDCRLYAACADLTVNTTMGIDSSQCAPNEAGFIFGLEGVIPSSLDLGALCSAGTDTDDSSLLEQAVTSLVTKAVADNTEVFMPPICVEGLDLNGVLNLSSPDAKLFGFTTDGGTGFADFLGITVGLGTP
jgi:hypothetical protein